MKALATSSADLRVNQSGSSWRRVDGVEAMIQQWRRRAATMWLRTAADMVLGSTPGFKCRCAVVLSLAQPKEAVGMDRKLQRAAPDDRLRPQKALQSNCAQYNC